MRKTYLALALASVLLAGSVYAAEERDVPPSPREEYGMGWGHRGGGPGRHHGWGGRGRDDYSRHRGPMGYGRRMGGDFRGGRGFGGGPGMGMGTGMGMGPHHRMVTDLDLSADQKAKLVDALTKNYRARMEIMMDMAAVRSDSWDLRRDGEASNDDIVAANRALGEARGRMEVQERTARDEIRGILTPEQRERLDRRSQWNRDSGDDDAPRPYRDGRRPGHGFRR